MIQCQNDFTQPINRLEAQMSHLVNTISDRNEETLPPQFLTIPNYLVILIGTKNHDVFETLSKIQFHHNILNLTNRKLWTNWQVFISRKLNLDMNVTLVPPLCNSVPIFESMLTLVSLPKLDPFFEPTLIHVSIDLSLIHI